MCDMGPGTGLVALGKLVFSCLVLYGVRRVVIELRIIAGAGASRPQRRCALVGRWARWCCVLAARP